MLVRVSVWILGLAASAHASELTAMRAELSAAREAARAAQSTGAAAARDAKLAAERQRGQARGAEPR